MDVRHLPQARRLIGAIAVAGLASPVLAVPAARAHNAPTRPAYRASWNAGPLSINACAPPHQVEEEHQVEE